LVLRPVWNRFRGVTAQRATHSRKAKRRERLIAFESLETKRLLASLPSGFTETRVASALSSPTSLDIAHDGRVFVAQQNGTIRIIKNDSLLSSSFAKITVDSNGERGLLGITLDPDFDHNGYLYVYYTATSPTSHNRVSRFTANGDKVVAGSEKVLLDFGSIGDAIWRMGGAVHFGPDGKLYISVGDQQDTSKPQKLDNPFGKILRINSDGTIPTDNPFYNSTTGINRAIWAYGLRNPYTTAFDPATGKFFINDVGQDTWEEIDEGKAGRNFGWPGTEGNFAQADHPNYTKPIYTYSHNNGAAITGGAFYSPEISQFPSKYKGDYFFVDFGTGEIRDYDLATKSVSVFATGTSFPTNLLVSSNGDLYYVSRGIGTGVPGSGTGQVFKVQYASASKKPTISIPPSNELAQVGGSATFSVSASGTGPFTYQWQKNNVNIPNATSDTYQVSNAAIGADGDKYRVIVTNAFGSTTSASGILTVTTDTAPTPSIDIDPDTLYVAGQSFHLTGIGTDLEDGLIDGSQFVWQVNLHHNTHEHPFVPPTGDTSTLDFTIPTVGETSDNVFYRVYLTVTDSVGLSTTIYRDILPLKSQITLQTNIPGLQLNLDGQPEDSGTTTVGVVGVQRTLEAPATQTVNGVTYMFDSWSDSGDRSHNISFPGSNTTYVANYEPVILAYISDLPSFGTETNGWGPIERDSSNGENREGDGGPIRLEGTTYDKGLGVHANSSIKFNLRGEYLRFLSDIGIDEEEGNLGSAVFQVYGDGRLLYQSSRLRGSSETQSIDVDVTGVQVLQLVVNDGGDGNSSDHADWANARLLADVNGSITPPPPPVGFNKFVSIPTAKNAHGVFTGDFNNDGFADLAVANAGSNRVSILLNDQNGGFEPGFRYVTGSSPKSVTGADLNDDGIIDLVLANQDSSTLSVLIGRGNGHFYQAVSYSANTRVHDVVIADFDNDGDLDIGSVGWGSPNARVIFNRGNGTFKGAKNYSTGGSAPHSVAAGDFNGDGFADIAVANRDSNSLTVLTNRRNGTFNTAKAYRVGTNPHMVKAGDVNGDGRLDLVVVNDGSDSVSVLLQNKSGSFFKAVNYATGSVPKGVAIGDINGDGLPDLVTTNTAGNYPSGNHPGSNTVTVLIGFGDGTFGRAKSFTTGVTPFSVVIADFNDDGLMDLATADWHTNDVAILYGR
jgi:glucose/arabinose dehydrogenase